MTAPSTRWRLTRRGRMLRDYLVLVLIIGGFIATLVFAWESGQRSQCHWYKEHRPQQAHYYCGR